MNMNVVTKLRLKKGWSQQDLARRSGVMQSVISRIENERYKNGVPLNHLKKIADALGIDVAELIGDEEESESESEICLT